MRSDDIGKIIIGIVIFLFYIIRLVAKSAAGTNKSTQQRPAQNFNNPYQQNNTANQNPFQQANFNQLPGKTQQQNSANQKPNYQNTFTSAENFNPMGNNPQPLSTSVYCMYCGKKFPNTKLLLMDTCFKHPNSEAGLQKHVLYRGFGKPNVGM